MKRYEIWLTAVLAMTGGLLAGFYLGHSVSAETAGDAGGRKLAAHATDSAGTGGDTAGANAGPSVANWGKRYAAIFEHPAAGQPTPGLAQAIAESLNQEEPYGSARIMMLIEMMRSEDFPVALEILRKARTRINLKSGTGGGPPVWIAFWQRYGERDPSGALTKALECADLTYADRKYLEKHLFYGMARNNPRAAAQAFLSHPQLPNRVEACQGLLVEWARVDLGAASQWTQQNLRDEILSSAYYAMAWGVSKDFEIAPGNEFLKTTPEGIARESALRSMKSQIANKPSLPAQQILDFISVSRSLGARDRKFESQMAARCADSDPMAAANYFSTPLSDGSESDYPELRTVSAKWIRSDPKMAETWIKGHEAAPYFSVVAGEYSRAAKEIGDAASERRWNDAIAATRAKVEGKR